MSSLCVSLPEPIEVSEREFLDEVVDCEYQPPRARAARLLVREASVFRWMSEEALLTCTDGSLSTQRGGLEERHLSSSGLP
jgi:hypothetical protein